ncbi:MAG TPA: hypothetical protein VH988_14785 [Thermoanaerobaculia bacterium]|nr:hypothetical protein [Thermoanaerobaculia bacterium]
MDAGTTPPATAKIRSWLANTKYTVNDSVFDADNGHFYTALVTGDSGSPPSDPFPINPARGALREFIVDGAVVWQDIGASPPAGKKPGAWSSVAIYQADEVVGAANHRFYKATTTGKPGALPTQPNFPVAEMNIVQEKPSTLTWQDSGTTAPAAVTAGQAPDQLLNLLTLTLPQAHALYHYNLAAGLVVSSVRAPTFVMQGATATQIDGPRSVDPVLLFTVYFRPIDAESDLKKPLSESPGLTLGLSLSSPSSSFYLGGSSDVLRNIQLVYGVNFTKVARLGPPGTSNLGSTSATPATTAQRYARGVFVGLTFNFSGFVQGLFGGGKGAQ